MAQLGLQTVTPPPPLMPEASRIPKVAGVKVSSNPSHHWRWPELRHWRMQRHFRWQSPVRRHLHWPGPTCGLRVSVREWDVPPGMTRFAMGDMQHMPRRTCNSK